MLKRNRAQPSRPACLRWWRIAVTSWQAGRSFAVRLQIRALRFAISDSGAAAAEYAFLIAFISIVAAAGMVLLGDDLRIYFEAIGASFENASTPTPDPFGS